MDEWRRHPPTDEWSPRYSGSVDSVPPETLDAAVRILHLLPEIEQLTIETTAGPVSVERRSSAAAWRAADRVALALLASSPDVTAIAAQSFDVRDGVRRATPADPFLTRDGGRAAALRASEDLGEIPPAEAERRHRENLEGLDIEDPLETLWDAPPL
jgi:hypothetical protein